MTIEQWNYFKPNRAPVINGGLPMISSIISLISGTVGVISMSATRDETIAALANFYMTPDEYINYSDTFRFNMDGQNDRQRISKVMVTKGKLSGKILLSKDIAGVANLITYSRKATQFTKLVRSISDMTVTLNRFSPKGKEFLFNFKVQFSKLSFVGQTSDFFKRYTEPSRSYESNSYRLKTGERINREQLYKYLANLKYKLKDVPKELEKMISLSYDRASEIYDHIFLNETTYENLTEAQPLFPNKIVLDDMIEDDKEEVMKFIFDQVDGDDMQKFLVANGLCNAFYGVTPISVKVKLNTPKKISPSKAVNSMLMYRVASKKKFKNPDISLTKTSRSMTPYAKEIEEAIDIVERIATNSSLLNEHWTIPVYEDNTISDAIMINDKVTKVDNNKMIMSAAGKKLFYLTADSIKNMMENKLMTMTVFNVDDRVIRLWYPENTSKYSVVSNYFKKYDKWSHYVFGPTVESETIKDWKGRELRQEEITFLTLENSSNVRISRSAPMMFVSVKNIEIPIRWVKPKMYGNREDFLNEFGILGNLEDKNPFIRYGADATNIMDRLIKDEDVTNDDIVSLLVANPTNKVKKACYRILGQNMYTPRGMKSDESLVTETDSVDYDVFGAIEMADINNDPEEMTALDVFKEINEITVNRAANSVGHAVARVLRSLERKYRTNAIEQLLTVFTKKLVGCAIIVSLSEE